MPDRKGQAKDLSEIEKMLDEGVRIGAGAGADVAVGRALGTSGAVKYRGSIYFLVHATGLVVPLGGPAFS